MQLLRALLNGKRTPHDIRRTISRWVRIGAQRTRSGDISKTGADLRERFSALLHLLEGNDRFRLICQAATDFWFTGELLAISMREAKLSTMPPAYARHAAPVRGSGCRRDRCAAVR
jgi:hypothetical protein